MPRADVTKNYPQSTPPGLAKPTFPEYRIKLTRARLSYPFSDPVPGTETVYHPQLTEMGTPA